MTCNVTKGDLSIEEFLKKIEDKIKLLIRDAADNKWHLGRNKMKKFRKFITMRKNVIQIIENGGKPEILFS